MLLLNIIRGPAIYVVIIPSLFDVLQRFMSRYSRTMSLG